MSSGYREFEELLPGYLSGDLPDKDRTFVEEWRKKLPGNEIFYQESVKAWESMSLLQEMEQFNSFEALKKVNNKISKQETINWRPIIQRIAAVMLVPLLIYSGYVTFRNPSNKQWHEEHTVTQTITSRLGMVTQLELADGTKVWLNSGSVLKYPDHFSPDRRQVELTGEAFFDVMKNPQQPFVVKAGKMNIEVKGTRFNVINYPNETHTELILESGSVRLFSGTFEESKTITDIKPGEHAMLDIAQNKLSVDRVDVEKYTAWKDGMLIFRDDKMDEVIRKLNRWFNVNIEVKNPEILEYVYTASFRDETLDQILELLKISAPISYQIVSREKQTNNTFSRKRIILKKQQ